ncbi:hypothetical protein MJ1_0639 [Nanobdella aerobiophila]|uniref:Uncharacterized protein n=1 Tax=Nanobdella aerobiophila TaxID=2586965 RepID=A0A915T079_9ARCH|nr:hypothetical protein [Nanobdella aerobiophila]BBL45784.1 hypothetical protein MJ1_0639 [Nanobdella aerobiophila]
MRNQYILLATMFITVLLSLLIIYNNKPINYINPELIGSNFQKSILYIYQNYGYNYIGNYTNLFVNYTNTINYNFSYICISSYNLSLESCNGNNINCCYYFSGYININSTILKYCDNNFTLYNPPDWICFCYNVNNSIEQYSNFFCT